MKRVKKMTAALTAAVLAAVFPFAAFSEASRLGDVDADGVTDRADAALLGQYLAGDAAISEDGMLNADMDGDGIVSEEDLDLLAAYEQELCITNGGDAVVTTAQDPENYSPWFTDEYGNTYNRGTNASISTTLEIAAYPQTVFDLGETFQTDGLKVYMINQRSWTTVTYDVSGALKIYTNFDAYTPGTYTVKIYTDYSGYEAKTSDCVTYEVTVRAGGTVPYYDETDTTTTATTATTATYTTTETTTTATTVSTGTTAWGGWDIADVPDVAATTQYVNAEVGGIATLVIENPPANATVTEVVSSDEKIVKLYEIDYLGDVISIHTAELNAGYAYVLATLSTGERYLFLITINQLTTPFFTETAEPIASTVLTAATDVLYCEVCGKALSDGNDFDTMFLDHICRDCYLAGAGGTYPGEIRTLPAETSATTTTTTTALISTTARSQNSTNFSESRGDIDENGEIGMSDAVHLAKATANSGSVSLTAQGRLNADLDGDGDLTGADLSRLLQFLGGALKML